MLKETFIGLLIKYTDDHNLINELWVEIEKSYSNKNRHYHSLNHLENLLIQLKEIKFAIQNWEAILFSLFYHDIVYNSIKSNNEEKSAELAETRMKKAFVPNEIIDLCKKQILATKQHIKSIDNDANYFIDADLSVLGLPWELYSLYYKNVRKEYSIYPDIIYNPGRKKVLINFLNREQIFKTNYFYWKYELQANLNIRKEIEML